MRSRSVYLKVLTCSGAGPRNGWGLCMVSDLNIFRTWLYSTLQPLYNTVRYNTVLDITRFKDGFQKCIDYIEK